MDLLEREEYLVELDRALDAPQSRLVLLGGEAGMGKTALVEAFVHRARHRSTALLGSCDPLTTPRPLGALQDIAHRLGGRLASATSRDDLYDVLLDALSGLPRSRPPLLVVEDAHWADEATLDALVFLGRRLARIRATVLVTYRDDELAADHPLRAAIAALPHSGIRRIALRPLSPAAVAAWATGSGHDPARVHHVTGGNPLLVGEVLATEEEVPESAVDLVGARLRTLSAGARHAAELVAVVPGRAGPDVTAGLRTELDAVLASGLVVPDGDGVRYRHELLRMAVAERLSPGRRAELHAAVLAVAPDVADPAHLAFHAERAGDVEALLRHAPAAAEAAAAIGSHSDALAALRPAMPHVDRIPPRRRAELLDRFAELAMHGGFATEALAALDRARPLWEELGAPDRVGDNLRATARASCHCGQPERSRRAIDQSTELLEAQPPGPGLALAYIQQAGMHMQEDAPVASLTWAYRAEQLAAEIGDPAAACAAAVTAGSVLLTHFGDGRPLQRAHRDALAAGYPDQAGRALVNAASSTLQRAEYAAAAPLAEEAITFCLDHGLLGFARFAQGLRARIRVETGDWVGAQTDADEAASWTGLAGARIAGLVASGLLRSRNGQAGAMAALDAAAEQAFPTQELVWIGPVAAARAEAFRLAGDDDQAIAEAQRWLPLARSRHHPWVAGELAWQVWRAGGGVPDVGVVDEPYARSMDGDWAGAADVWDARGRPFARAEALACGDPDAVTAALTVADGYGATAVARHWRTEQRRLGIRVARGPRAATAGNPAGLTTRQLEVLALLAEGLSNAEIAEQLVLSVKTTGHHVSAVLARLDVRSRGQAAAAARRLGVV